MYRKGALALTLAAALMLVVGCNTGPSGEQGEKTIKIDYGVPTSTYPALYVAQDLGLFKKHGIQPTFHSFQTGAPLLAGLKSGSLDVVTTGMATIFAIGQGIPLKYVVWEGNAAPAEGLIARKGLGLASWKDVTKDLKYAAPTGTCAQVSLYYLARAANLTYKELNIVDIAPPLYANALSSASFDVGIAWSPYLQKLAAKGHNILGYDPMWVPGGTACPDMTAARPAVLDKYPDLGRKLVAVHAEAMRAIDQNRTRAVDALVNRLSITPEVADQVLDRYAIPKIEEQLDPESRYAMVGDDGLVAILERAAGAFVDLGVLPQKMPTDTLRKAVDPQYLKHYEDTRS